MDHERDEHPELTPTQIRAIRERLGLTQLQAGELLGGGPRAFTKYEAGSVKPAASVVALLRVLDAKPAMLAALRGGQRRHVPSSSSPDTPPFEISGDHIQALNPITFTQLLRRLLCAEAVTNALPLDSIHVASDITAPDGGEDGYIGWDGDPVRTKFLPCQKNQFQLKCGKVPPSSAAREVLTRNGEVKPMVREVLAAGGCYIMLSSHTFTRHAIGQRERRIRESLSEAGLEVSAGQVQFRDADQLATWVNRYPSVATWVKELTQPGAVEPFYSWNHWALRSEHEDSPWVEDSRFPSLRETVLQRITEEQGVVHIAGLPDVGKSRLVLESLAPTDEADRWVCGFVMYADEAESGPEKIMHTSQVLAMSEARAIIVVDRCTPKTRRAIATAVNRPGSRLSLVTIEDDASPTTLDPQSVIVPEAPPDVTEAMVEHLAPNLPSEDKRRLGKLSRGFPGVASPVVRAWRNSVSIPRVAEEDIVEELVVGRESSRPEALRASARLLAVFGALRVGQPAESQMREVSHYSPDLAPKELYAGIQRLIGRGAAKKLGRFAAFPPSPIALHLAERQWQEWTPDRWDETLASNISSELMVLAARRLALLNASSNGTSHRVTAHVCRHGGPLEGHICDLSSSHAEVLTFLVQIDASQVVALLERSLGRVDLSRVKDEVRTDIVWTLEQAAFRQDTFEDAASLLLDLAAAENEPCATRATEAFTELFPLLLGKTEADGALRLAFLDAATKTSDPRRRLALVEALIAGVKTEHFHRDVGAETHGLRPTLHSWRPTTTAEAAGYVTECVKLVTAFATKDDPAGKAAREGLGESLRSLISSDLVDFELLEWVVDQARNSQATWKEAMRSLNHFLRFDAQEASPSVVNRVKALADALQPSDLKQRALHLISQYVGDYPPGEDSDLDVAAQRLDDEIRRVAEELVSQPETPRGLLREASSGLRLNATWFGECIAGAAESPLDWLEPIQDAFLAAPEDDRNSNLLGGFLYGLSKKHEAAVNDFKQNAAQSAQFAPTLPYVCWLGGITPDDIVLVTKALRAKLLGPRWLEQWTIGRELRKLSPLDLAPLLDAMLDHGPDGFEAAVDLICAYAVGDDEKLDRLWPQIVRIAECDSLSKQAKFEGAIRYQFENLMTEILKRKRRDAKARALALKLARAFVESIGAGKDRLIEPLLPFLLEDFPEISWPLIGQAIVSNEKRQSWLLEFALGDRPSPLRQASPAILSLPDETLFAWCEANRDRAPAFAAATVPFFESDESGGSARKLHRVMTKLIDEFASCKGVLEAVSQNMRSYSWVGSATNRVQLYREPLMALQDHPNRDVRKWARIELEDLEPWTEELSAIDAESQVRSEI